MKVKFVAIAVLLVSMLATAPAATAVEKSGYASPLRVKVASEDGKPKIKVARKLKVLLSCSSDCRGKVRIVLKTPANTTKVGGSRLLGAGDIWITGIRLTGFGLNYLKKNYRSSVLKVSVTATDSVTGRKVSKNRNFRFYR